MPGAPSGGGAAVCPLRECVYVCARGQTGLDEGGKNDTSIARAPKEYSLGVACAY